MNLYTNILPTLFLLAIILPASAVCGQFLTTGIVVGSKVQVKKIVPLSLWPHPDFETGALMLRGITTWQITAQENLIVSATVSHDGRLVNQTGHELPLATWLGYRNDGGNPYEPPSQKLNNAAQFMMSNSGLLIQNMRPRQSLLSAYLYLGVKTGQPQFANSTYEAAITVNMEFN